MTSRALAVVNYFSRIAPRGFQSIRKIRHSFKILLLIDLASQADYCRCSPTLVKINGSERISKHFSQKVRLCLILCEELFRRRMANLFNVVVAYRRRGRIPNSKQIRITCAYFCIL